MKPGDPRIDTMLRDFLSAYRTQHGIESVQIVRGGYLWPLKAAREWTAYFKGKSMKTTPKKLADMQEKVSQKFDAKKRPTREEGSRLLAKVNELKRGAKQK